MRAILFRGKRKDTGEWVYGSYVYASKLKAPDGTVTKEIHTIVPAVFDENTPPDDVFVAPETIGQYTGLQDKNGVKIFEGDIVKADDVFMSKFCPHQFYLIGYWRSSCRMYFYPCSEKQEDLELFNVPLFNSEKYIEVIGNIHDNPELLEVQE